LLKYLEQICLLRDIEPFLKESSLFPKEVVFFLGNNHVLRENEFFFPKNVVAPQGNLSLISFGNMVVP
jgi:hypothetical protein